MLDRLFRRFVPAFLAAAAVLQADQADDVVKAELQRQRIPGLALAVVKDGKIIKATGYGFANRKLGIPVGADTVFKIASVSKQFIATGIMLLVQEGTIALDNPISRYLDDTPPAWQSITIRHVLTHTSGLIREAPGFDPMKVESDAAVIRSSYSLPLRFTPGQQWEYGNVGYYVLAEVIHKTSGMAWTEYLTEKIFNPAGMSTTHPTDTRADVPNRAQGYVDNDRLLEADDWLALRPSGAFLSTVLDLAKWDAALYSDSILTEGSRRQMWTPVQLSNGTSYPYGFGWELGSIRGHRLVHHSGGIPGFRSEFARFPDDHLSIIFLANLDDSDPSAILGKLAAIYLP